MAKSFITVLNRVITGKHHGDLAADLYGTPYYGHEKIEVPFAAEILALEPLEYYDAGWQRKSNEQLIAEGLMPIPKGYVLESGKPRPMTQEERVIVGLDAPKPGFKVEGGEIVPMSLAEQLAAGQITQEEHEKRMTAENENELQRRLAELQTPEALAQAEMDEGYAAERKSNLIALLAVKKQQGWPLEVIWPSE